MPAHLSNRTALLALTLLSCGEAEDGDRECAERSGSYTISFDERDGTCGPIPESLETIDEQPTEPEPPCTGEIRYSEDNCRVTSDAVCPEDGLGAGWTSELDSVTDWDSDGRLGDGLFEIVIKDADGAVQCRSTYDATARRR